MTRARWLILPALVAPGSLSAQSSESVTQGVSSITAADITRRIGVIADDSMRGRSTPSPELEKTAAYIASEFRRFGLTPGGDSGTFIQRYALHSTALDTAASVVAISGGHRLRFGIDAIPGAGGRDADVSGKMIILTGGQPAALSQLGLNGSVVVIPLAVDDPFGRNHPLVQNLGVINAQRPAATILVVPAPDAQWQATARGAMSGRLGPAWRAQGTPRSSVVVAVRERSLRPLLEQRGVDYATLQKASTGAARATPVDVTVSITLKPAVESNSSAPNTVGILEGADATLKNEYIVFSGHMDHIGVAGPTSAGCQPTGADSICNGADDDGSGTIAVVELAEAFAKLDPHPKRSLIFLTVSGEERGLWGSDYFSSNPPAPISQIVADLNTDMVGRNWKDTIVAIGKEHSDLGATLNRVNQAHRELRMTAIDDLWPQENFYRRSDHFNFARNGVPVLFFFNGTHPDYHRAGDEVSKIDGEKESRIVKLVFYLGLDIANAKEKPKWNPESYKQIVRPTP